MWQQTERLPRSRRWPTDARSAADDGRTAMPPSSARCGGRAMRALPAGRTASAADRFLRPATESESAASRRSRHSSFPIPSSRRSSARRRRARDNRMSIAAAVESSTSAMRIDGHPNAYRNTRTSRSSGRNRSSAPRTAARDSSSSNPSTGSDSRPARLSRCSEGRAATRSRRATSRSQLRPTCRSHARASSIGSPEAPFDRCCWYFRNDS